METGVDRYARYACLTPKRAGNLLKKYGERPLLKTVYSKPEASSYCSISMAVFLPLHTAAGAVVRPLSVKAAWECSSPGSAQEIRSKFHNYHSPQQPKLWLFLQERAASEFAIN